MKTRLTLVFALVVLSLARPTLAQSQLRLTVEEAVSRAVEDGFEIAEAEADIETAREARKGARALFGPRVMVEGKAFYFNERPTFDMDIFSAGGNGDMPLWLDQALGSLIPEGPIEAGEQYNVDFRVSVVQPLTKLEAIAELSKVKSLDIDIAEVNAVKAATELAYQVRETAYTLLKIRDSVTALEETEQEVLARQKQVQAFRKAELVGPEEILEVNVGLAEVRSNLITTRAYESVAESRLRMLLRLIPNASIEIADPGPSPPLPDLEESIAKAVETRPELRELRLRMKQADVGVRAKMQEWVPDVSLVASYQYQAGTSIGQPELAVGAVMSWTPWAWGETYYGVREAKARARKVRIVHERIVQLIGLDVENAHAKARASLENTTAAKAIVEQAEELYRVEQARLSVQYKTATDLLAAQTSLLRARIKLSTARYDYLIALAALKRATGEQ